MDFTRLQNNMIDVVKEEQIKLGYREEQTKMDGGFLREFIAKIGGHGCTIEELLAIFKKYSGHVHFEKMSNGEFDYLIYFEDGKPDSYRYCITDEGCYMIYHRFTPEDYRDL